MTLLSSLLRNFTITILVVIIISILTFSCARWGKPLKLQLTSGETISLKEIIAELRENDNRIKTLRGRGTFTLKTPQIDTIYQLHQSDIEYNYPDYLHAVGRKYTAVVLKLTCLQGRISHRTADRKELLLF